MTRRALPYRIPSEEVVKADAWMLLLGEERITLPDVLPDWDYQMDLDLYRPIQVDVDRARVESGLPADAELGLAVVWWSTGSGLRAPGHSVGLARAGTMTIELSPRLRGADLGGRLILDTALVLSRPTSHGGPIAPRRAGSVLWSDRRVVGLQGDAPQFPIAVIDFAKTSFPNGAAWHLQISGNLYTATMGSLLLLVNERNTAVVTAFQNAAKPRPIDRIVLSAVYTDVARVMLEYGLRDDDFVDEVVFPEDSMGATLMALFNRRFPGRSINDLRLLHRHSPSLFASEVQASVMTFGDM